MRAIRLIAAKIAILLFAAPNLRNDLLGFFDELLGIFFLKLNQVWKVFGRELHAIIARISQFDPAQVLFIYWQIV